MDMILNSIPIIFVASFVAIVIMAIRNNGEGAASTCNFDNDLPASNNINGLPMAGGVDVLGNPYGTTHNH